MGLEKEPGIRMNAVLEGGDMVVDLVVKALVASRGFLKMMSLRVIQFESSLLALYSSDRLRGCLICRDSSTRIERRLTRRLVKSQVENKAQNPKEARSST